MKMLKCLTGILAALLFTTGAFAQTAEEIIARAETQMNQPTDDGYYMVMEMKIPLIGTLGTQAYTRGDKMRLEMNKDGKQDVTYIDGETEWEYDSSKNEVTIKTAKKNKSNDTQENMKMLKGFSNGYKPVIRKETADAWYIRCTKTRENTNKDDPNKIDLIISKADYSLLSMSATVSLITITMRDFAYGVPESRVTFNPDEFPGATIVDTREVQP